MADHKKLHDMITRADPEVMKRVEKVLEGHCAKALAPGGEGGDAEAVASEVSALDDQAQAALKAVVRILTPFKEQISPLLLHEVLEVAGLGPEGDDESEDEGDMEGDDMEGDMVEKEVPGAMRVGDGRQKGGYPDDDKPDEISKIGFKAIPAKIESEKEDDLPLGEPTPGRENDGELMVKKGHLWEAKESAEKAYKDHLEKLGYRAYPDAEMAMKTKDGKPMMKAKGETVAKSAPRADLSRVDAATRRELEAVFKTSKELIRKNADLESRLADRDAKDRERELVQKAATFNHVGLPQDELVATLRDADKAGKDAYERVCKNFATLNAQGRSSMLFSEIGTSAPGMVGGDSNAIWKQIENSAAGWVQKSGTRVSSSAEGVEAFLQSPDGQRLYSDYKAARGGI